MITLVEGFYCVAYRARHICPEQLKEITERGKCFTSDDMALSLHLASRNIGARALTFDTIGSFSFGQANDALHIMQDHRQSYETCVEEAI
jgi:hypothetical protein